MGIEIIIVLIIAAIVKAVTGSTKAGVTAGAVAGAAGAILTKTGGDPRMKFSLPGNDPTSDTTSFTSRMNSALGATNLASSGTVGSYGSTLLSGLGGALTGAGLGLLASGSPGAALAGAAILLVLIMTQNSKKKSNRGDEYYGAVSREEETRDDRGTSRTTRPARQRARTLPPSEERSWETPWDSIPEPTAVAPDVPEVSRRYSWYDPLGESDQVTTPEAEYQRPWYDPLGDEASPLDALPSVTAPITQGRSSFGVFGLS